MSSRWGDSQRDRDALDRHITGNYGEDQFRDDDIGREIAEGMGAGPNLTKGEWLEIWWTLMVFPNQYNADARRKIEAYLDKPYKRLHAELRENRNA